jgi:AraC family transcriptional regulator of adaptative response/methylated-DNA-[protein]-cysteine methyltransferase
MQAVNQLCEDYQRIEQAIRYIEANAHAQPELGEIAANLNLSEYHFQRLFTRWAGISPKRFLQYLTKENAKTLLAHSTNLLNATYAAGLSSPGRLHDLFVQTEAVTPGEYKSKGAGVEITYGFHPTPFGECLLAVTGRGICFLAFVDGNRPFALEQLRQSWANAALTEDPARTTPIVEQVFSLRPGALLTPRESRGITLHLRGTNFQIKQGLGGAAAPVPRTGHQLRVTGRAGLLGQCRAGGRERRCPQPGGVSHPLSPCAPENRPFWELPLRSNPQKSHPGLGNGSSEHRLKLRQGSTRKLLVERSRYGRCDGRVGCFLSYRDPQRPTQPALLPFFIQTITTF